MTFKHTDKTDARIRRGYQAGERILDIAGELGVTRSVIIGRARRIGLATSGRQFQAVNPGSFDQTQEGKRRARSCAKSVHFDPDRHARVITALHAGRDRYNANRKANHSANLASEQA